LLSFIIIQFSEEEENEENEEENEENEETKAMSNQNRGTGKSKEHRKQDQSKKR